MSAPQTIARQQADALHITLRYDGPDVADGSMAADDMVSAIQGFSSAYEKLAKRENVQAEHRIRVTALEKSSADIVIGVWEWLGNNPHQLEGLKLALGSAAGIVTVIAGVMKLKKHVAGKAFTLGTVTVNVISVKNSENVSIEVAPQHYTIFQEKLIDDDVAKIVRPLRKGKIDVTEFKVPQMQIHERISAEDRDSFLAERTVVTTKEDWVDGYLVSLNKESNVGTFRLMNGRSVPYKLASDSPETMYEDFAYRGPVRVYGKATFDENLTPSRIDISKVERVQGTLLLGEGE